MITELLCSWRLPNFIFSYSKQTTCKELITILQKWLLWEAPFFLSIQWLQNTTQRFLDTSVLILSYLYIRIVGKKQIFSAEAWNAIPWGFFRISKLQSFTEYFSLTLVFIWNGTLREKFSLGFFKRFLLVLTKFSFWQGDWALGYHSMKFRHFPDIS